MKPPGGIDYQKIGFTRSGGLNGIVSHGCCISTLLLGDDIYAQTPAPGFYLFDSAGPEGVAGR